MSVVLLIALVAVAAWTYLVLGHGRFWLAHERLEAGDPAPAAWPGVVAVVPARDEADVVARAVGSLLAQDYRGPFRVVLVDDESRDGTGAIGLGTARALGGDTRFSLVRTPPRPAGWVGKMWAVNTGVAAAAMLDPEARYLLLTDADVVHSRGNVRRLVSRAEARDLGLVSLMVRLHQAGGWERLLVPAFVYFFQMLYPFPWVNDPKARTAGAAGGCMLVRRTDLTRAGGIAPLRGEVIDDCALGRAIKRRGAHIWLGVTATEYSIRPYRGLGGVWSMVARSAYTQLRHSPALLAAALVGLTILYVVPPLAVLAWPAHGDARVAIAGLAAWLAMAGSFMPTLALYGESPLVAFGLPLAGLLYAGMTLDSARRHYLGRGAEWKGRTAAGRAGSWGDRPDVPRPSPEPRERDAADPRA